MITVSGSRGVNLAVYVLKQGVNMHVKTCRCEKCLFVVDDRAYYHPEHKKRARLIFEKVD